MNFKPLNDYILISPCIKDNYETNSGIVIPSESDNVCMGRIVELPAKHDRNLDLECFVWYNKNDAILINIGNVKYHIIKEELIFGVEGHQEEI